MTARIAGAVLGVSALAELVAVARHPSAGHGDLLAGIVAAAGPDAAVHAIVIAATAGLMLGLTVWSQRRGTGDITTMAALIAYALGAVVLVAAATIDGFIVPGIARHGLAASAQGRAMSIELLSASLIAILACTKIGLGAIVAAIVLWSAPLVRGRGGERGVTAFGAIAALATLAILVSPKPLGPHVLALAAAAQTLWYLSVAALLFAEPATS